MTQPLRVTFDSNVYQHVVRPDSFPGDSEICAIRNIHEALKDGRVLGYISETIFTLEAIKKTDRPNYFSTLKPKLSIQETEMPNGKIKIGFKAGPDSAAHLGTHGILDDTLLDAINLGFKVLSCPRIGVPRPQVLKDEYFIKESNDDIRSQQQEKYFALLRELEKRGVGRSRVERLGIEYATRSGKSMLWHQGLGLARSDIERSDVAKAVAEWSDTDTISAHVGYGNDLFCTRDNAKEARISVFNEENRTWLMNTHGVKFVTLSMLADSLP